MKEKTEARATGGMTVLCRTRVQVAEHVSGVRGYYVAFEDQGRTAKRDEIALLAVHYYTHVLARYPRENNSLDVYGMTLRQMVSDIVEQGLWPGSNLFEYAGIATRAIATGPWAERAEIAGQDEPVESMEVKAVLFRSILGNDLNLGLEVPAGLGEDALCDSVVAVLQAVVDAGPEPQIELLDKSLRYLRTYIGEGANYGSPAAAQNLANRAFREAGGDAV